MLQRSLEYGGTRPWEQAGLDWIASRQRTFTVSTDRGANLPQPSAKAKPIAWMGATRPVGCRERKCGDVDNGNNGLDEFKSSTFVYRGLKRRQRWVRLFDG